jgi:excinuclease UvrABC ATPase subunit
VIFEGTQADLIDAEHSLTGRHLRQRLTARASVG